MASQRLKLLLVEDSAEDQHFVGGALAELEEGGPRFEWFAADTVTVDYLSDAIHCLARAKFDAILLDLHLPDSSLLLNTFTSVRRSAEDTPILVLMDTADESLATRLIREGAQEVVMKPEIECVLLARSIRHAIERQRRTSGLHAAAMFDDLTGLYSRAGFLNAAAHDMRAARLGGVDLSVVVVDLTGLPDASHDRDLALIDAAALFQDTFAEAATHGRIDGSCFAATFFGVGPAARRVFVRNFEGRLGAAYSGVKVAVCTAPVLPSSDIHETIEGLRRSELAKPAMLAG